MQVQSLDGRSPGEGMATHSSTLAWRIPWTEEHGRLHYSPWGLKSRTQLNYWTHTHILCASHCSTLYTSPSWVFTTTLTASYNYCIHFPEEEIGSQRGEEIGPRKLRDRTQASICVALESMLFTTLLCYFTNHPCARPSGQTETLEFGAEKGLLQVRTRRKEGLMLTKFNLPDGFAGEECL